MYYASFSREQNSYLKFKNPFEGIFNLSKGSITLWAKTTAISDDGENQTGRLFECKDSMIARLDDDTLRFVVGMRNNSRDPPLKF